MLYTFRCRKCKQVTQNFHAFNEDHPTECACGGKLYRIFDKPNIIYRPGGFRTTDKRLEPTEDD